MLYPLSYEGGAGARQGEDLSAPRWNHDRRCYVSERAHPG